VNKKKKKMKFEVKTPERNIQWNKVKFEITLCADFWFKSPQILIKVDGMMLKNINDLTPNKNTVIDCEAKMKQEPKTITIERHGKNKWDTVVNEGKIVRDSKVEIIDVKKDGMSMRENFNKSFFMPYYAEPWASEQKDKGVVLAEKIDNCTDLYYNGKWQLNL
jgi:hypothetical protein